MRIRTAAALLLLPFAHASAALPDGFGWFADVVGACWSGTFPDGKTRHTHCYTSQYDRYIRGTSTLAVEADGKPAAPFLGDSVFAWNAQEGRIDYYIWSSTGAYSAHQAHYAGDDLAFPIADRKDPSKIAYRSLWHRIDADTFDVQRQVPDGDGWKTELTVRYTRQPLQP